MEVGPNIHLIHAVKERINDLKDPAYSRAIYPRFGYAMKWLAAWILARYVEMSGCQNVGMGGMMMVMPLDSLDLWNGVHFFEEPQTGVCSKIPRSDLELPEVSEFGESRDVSPPVKFGTGHWNSFVVPLDPDAHIIEPSARGKGKGQMQGLLGCGYWDPPHVLFHTVGQESTMTVGSCVSFPLGSSNRQLITVL